MEDVDVEIPQYFICPISLQIMRDPVTTITGITYDRESIEQWLFTNKNTSCPLTKQPLPMDSDLTPNHTLRRLIQAWCSDNASLGVDRIPTPKPCFDKLFFVELIKGLSAVSSQQKQGKTLKRLEMLAVENERNRKYMVEAGIAKAMAMFIVSNCYKKKQVIGLQEALSLLRLVGVPTSDWKAILGENDQVIQSLTWVLRCKNLDNHNHGMVLKSNAVWVLKKLLGEASLSVLERLDVEFFETIIGFLREKHTQHGINSALQVLLDACPWGRNRIMMIELGAVFRLIEFELGSPERRTTELILGILVHLCSSADGRAQFLSHTGGLAVISQRILTVSPVVDDRAVLVISMICKHSGSNSTVLQEMLTFQAARKLCILLQSEHGGYGLKHRAKEILRSHYHVWKDSPCFSVKVS